MHAFEVVRVGLRPFRFQRLRPRSPGERLHPRIGRNLCTLGRMVLLGWIVSGLPCAATPENLCDLRLNVSYIDGDPYGTDGSKYDVHVSFGTGSITGGASNTLTVDSVRFYLDCTQAGLPGCQDNGDVIAFIGVLSTNCGTAQPGFWIASVSGNLVTLVPASPLVIPANQPSPPGFCALDFRMRVQSVQQAETDAGSPLFVEQETEVQNARCDNGHYGTASSWTGLPLCPSCDDGNVCTTEACNTVSGQCQTIATGPVVVNDTVRLTRPSPAGARIAWSDVAGTYNVYRGSRGAGVWSYNLACFAPGTTTGEADDPSVPPQGSAWYYLVSRVASCGESPLGFDSIGRTIPAGTHCP